MKRFVTFSVAACTLAGLSWAFAPPAHAQTDAPQMVNGKPVALSVTGEGEVEVAPIGFSLDINFYNDAAGEDIARLQNVQTEEKLRKAVLGGGIAPASIRFYAERVTGTPGGTPSNPSVQQVFQNGQSTLKPLEPARSMRNMVVFVRGMNKLRPLISALQSVGATGSMNLSYAFAEEKTMRDQTLKAAVADAAAQARIMETAAAPRTLRLVTMEAGEFVAPNYTRTLPLAPPEREKGELPAAYSTVAYQSVTLRYALADTPTAPTAPKKPAVAPAKPPVKKR